MNIQYFINERLMVLALVIVGAAFVVCLIGAACHVISSDKRGD